MTQWRAIERLTTQPGPFVYSATRTLRCAQSTSILRTLGALEAIREGEADAAAGRFVDNDEIKARYRAG